MCGSRVIARLQARRARRARPLLVGREERSHLVLGRPPPEPGQLADQLDVGEIARRQQVVAALALEGEHLDRPRADAGDRAQALPGRLVARQVGPPRGDLARRSHQRDRALRAPARRRRARPASVRPASRRGRVAQRAAGAPRPWRRTIERWIAAARRRRRSAARRPPRRAPRRAPAAAAAAPRGGPGSTGPISGSPRKRAVEPDAGRGRRRARSACARSPWPRRPRVPASARKRTPPPRARRAPPPAPRRPRRAARTSASPRRTARRRGPRSGAGRAPAGTTSCSSAAAIGP